MRKRRITREPHDLLVTDGLACSGPSPTWNASREDHSSSHRHFRNQLGSVGHMCAEDPCGAPEEEGWHVQASAVIPRNQAYDLQEAAGRGALGGCLMATRFWGCRGCFCFTLIARLMAWIFRRLFGCYRSRRVSGYLDPP